MTKDFFFPKSFNPPNKISHNSFILEVLAAKHNEIDYEAWTSSKEELKGIFGPKSNWPGDVFSLEQNLIDLENHYREFKEREAFTYTILNKDKNKCLGCLYIRPSKATQYNCRVDFWFRKTHKDMEDMFYTWVYNWLIQEWGFEKVAFPGRDITWDQYYEILVD
jgi:hypothetical protein